MAANKLLKNDVLILREQGKTYQEISSILNCSLSTIKYHLRNISKRGVSLKMTLDMFKEMKSMLSDGVSQKEVSEKFNISISSIKRYRNLTYDEYVQKLSKNSKKVVNWRKRKKIELIRYKGGSCEICGYNKCISALDFHHKNPKEKDFSISGKSFSYERLKKEVDKCILVCSNCHAEIHEKEINGL